VGVAFSEGGDKSSNTFSSKTGYYFDDSTEKNFDKKWQIIFLDGLYFFSGYQSPPLKHNVWVRWEKSSYGIKRSSLTKVLFLFVKIRFDLLQSFYIGLANDKWLESYAIWLQICKFIRKLTSGVSNTRTAGCICETHKHLKSWEIVKNFKCSQILDRFLSYLYGPQKLFSIKIWPEEDHSSGMWPSDQFEFETLGLVHPKAKMLIRSPSYQKKFVIKNTKEVLERLKQSKISWLCIMSFYIVNLIYKAANLRLINPF
jgi:hypothetical protein